MLRSTLLPYIFGQFHMCPSIFFSVSLLILGKNETNLNEFLIHIQDVNLDQSACGLS